MIKDIKKIVCLKKASELLILLLVAFVITLVNVVAFLSGVNDDVTIFIAFISGIFSYVGFAVFFKPMMIPIEVPRGLSFGMTRHKLFVWSRIMDFAELFVLFLPLIFIPDFGVAVYLKLLILCFGVIMWVEGLAANSILRFGKAAYFVYYFAFIALVMAISRVYDKIPGFSEQMGKIFTATLDTNLANFNILVVFLLFTVAGLIVNWMTFRNVSVDYTA